MYRNEAATVSVHFVEHRLLVRFAMETGFNIFAAWLVVCKQVVKNTPCLYDVNLSVSILFILVEVRHNSLLKVGECLLECLGFLLFDFTDKVIELKCLLVVNTNDLVRARLEQAFDACKWGHNSDVLREFGSAKLPSILEFPNLEFALIERRGHYVAQVRASGTAIASNKIRWIL